MILIDSRVGSADLAGPLKHAGLPVLTTQLPFGDVAFEGKGAGNTTLDIGIELKKLPDLIASLRSGRLSGHQLPGLIGPNGAYDYAWLLIEGRWQVSSTGMIEQWKYIKKKRKWDWEELEGHMPASEMSKRVLVLELCGGLHVQWCNTRDDTIHFLSTLYRCLTDKSLDSHTSHLIAHTPHAFLPVSPFRISVQSLPGVGPRVSLAVEQHFGGSLVAAVNAHAEEWAAITTLDKKGKPRRLGTAVASKIYNYCRGKS